jgi:hypothetical protein
MLAVIIVNNGRLVDYAMAAMAKRVLSWGDG